MAEQILYKGYRMRIETVGRFDGCELCNSVEQKRLKENLGVKAVRLVWSNENGMHSTRSLVLCEVHLDELRLAAELVLSQERDKEELELNPE